MRAFLALGLGLALGVFGCDSRDDQTTDPPPRPEAPPARPEVENKVPPGPQSPAQEAPFRSPDPLQGSLLFGRHCAICHGPEGAGKGMNAHYLPGVFMADLSESGYLERRGVETVRKIISEGGRNDSGHPTPMPAYGRTLTPVQLDDLLAFLHLLPDQPHHRPENLSTSSDPACGTCHNIGGEKLLAIANCAGCHLIPGQSRRPQMAPSLTGVGLRLQRAWLHHFLEMPFNRRAAGYVPLQTVRMPDFGLTLPERNALTEFLSSQTTPAIPWSGRYEPNRSTDASLLEQKVKPILEEKRCLACHKLGREGGKVGPDLTGVGNRLEPQWIYQWILAPQKQVPGSPMPDLGILPSEARILTEYLTTRTSPEAAAARGHGPDPDAKPTAKDREPESSNLQEKSRLRLEGENLYIRLGCWGCHDLEGYSFPMLRKTHGLVGPELTLAGDRLSADWIYDFLWTPHIVRPELGARMPRMRFTEDEIMTLIPALKEIAAREGPVPRQETGKALLLQNLSNKRRRQGLSRLARGGHQLFIAKDCHSCHRLGATQFPPVRAPYFPEPENRRRRRWAPDLAHAHRRLLRPFAFSWMLDPGKMSGKEQSLMPKVGLDEDEAALLLEYLVPPKETKR